MTKTFDKKDVYSWHNAEDARKYIGKFGYFSDCCFDDLKDWSHGELTQIYPFNDIDEIFSFNDRSSFDDRYKYGLFLPEEKVTEVKEEKKYRPFDNQGELREYFNRITMIGYVLDVQDKLKSKRYMLQVTGTFKNGLILPLYGAITWEQLFAYFTLYKDGKWHPFGVEE